jgi:hypothetical protein
MAEQFTPAAALGQTAPVDRLRDSRKGAIDREGARRRPRKPGAPAPAAGPGPEPEDPGDAGTAKPSGNIVDIVI